MILHKTSLFGKAEKMFVVEAALAVYPLRSVQWALENLGH